MLTSIKYVLKIQRNELIVLPVAALDNFPLPLPGSKLEHFNNILLLSGLAERGSIVCVCQSNAYTAGSCS